MSQKVMSMGVSNPAFDDLAVLPGNQSSMASNSPFKKVSKTMLLGFGCAVAAVAFAGGYFAANAGSSSSSTSDAGAGDPDAALEESLASIVETNANLTKLSATDMSEVISAYLEDPTAFDDAFIPTEFAALLSAAAVEEGFEPDARRRLAASAPPLSAYRTLSEASPLAKAAFERIESGNYPDPVTTRDDVATVYREGNTCHIVVQETNSVEDWINNIDLGKEDVWSINKSNQRNKACGCEKKRLWWCRRWRTCPVNTKLGRSYDGFGKAWNEMRGGIYSRIQSKCGGVSEYIFAGYSRGGGIISVGAFALWKEGLLPANKMKLVTFGCPRALTSGSSNEVHNKFLVERHVFKNDPVPTIPPNWWGFKHYGKHICEGCRKLGRNRPYVTNIFGIGDHTSYDKWIN